MLGSVGPTRQKGRRQGKADAVEAIRSGLPAALLKSASRHFSITDACMQGIVRVPTLTATGMFKASTKFRQLY
ncbi:hypothetical protein [Noviherbaspirillum pedocola]|uniref:Uncharacterized protein n=1 Tax=Noviherbaspirillum pedocola TaxID=2801341 RepID=A0A934W6H0_9BURK|nr:hypothetical protein [Noviherbaspirillum pedocola]MBK4734353.1 hypothetical protein [Noviherbaspirillum pedocola]